MAKFRYVEWLYVWLRSLTEFTFEWDSGNQTKSAQKHGVTCEEVEEVFRGRRFIPLGQQAEPVATEPRFAILGETYTGRFLFLAFTIRDEKIRVISARAMDRKEKNLYGSLREE